MQAGKDAKKAEALTDKLLKAVEKKDLKAAKKLLDKGANPNGKISWQYGFRTPFLAALSGTPQSYEMTRLLWSHGAVVDCTDSDLEYPLNYACGSTSGEQYAIVQFLLDKGARVEFVRDTYPLSALCMVGTNRSHASAVLPLTIKVAKLLMDKGASVQDGAGTDHDVIYNCAQWFNLPLMEFLMSKGARANVCRWETENGAVYETTPLHAYIQEVGYGYLLPELAEEGERLKLYQQDIKATVDLLLKNGADKNVKNSDGKSPVDLAREDGDALTALLGW